MIGPRQAAVLRAMPVTPIAAPVIANRLPQSQRGGLYMTLKRLQARGLVTSAVEGGVRRWSLLAKGLAELRLFDELVGRPADDDDPLGLAR